VSRRLIWEVVAVVDELVQVKRKKHFFPSYDSLRSLALRSIPSSCSWISSAASRSSGSPSEALYRSVSCKVQDEWSPESSRNIHGEVSESSCSVWEKESEPKQCKLEKRASFNWFSFFVCFADPSSTNLERLQPSKRSERDNEKKYTRISSRWVCVPSSAVFRFPRLESSTPHLEEAGSTLLTTH